MLKERSRADPHLVSGDEDVVLLLGQECDPHVTLATAQVVHVVTYPREGARLVGDSNIEVSGTERDARVADGVAQGAGRDREAAGIECDAQECHRIPRGGHAGEAHLAARIGIEGGVMRRGSEQ